MADQKNQVFTKVSQLRPLDEGLNLTVKVLSAKTVIPKGRGDGNQSRPIVECLVGDETGIIICTARNDQVIEMMKEGNALTLSNVRVDMWKGSSMRLAVRPNSIKVAESADFAVKEDNNVSLIEFERIDVVV